MTMPSRSASPGRAWTRVLWGALFGLLGAWPGASIARPYVPTDEATVLAVLPPGTRHAELAQRLQATRRLDVAQFYIEQARRGGDLRFLGYAQALLEPWAGPTAQSADALVLYATIEQSRHEFTAALATLQRALQLRPSDPQALITSATVLRVLGRFAESRAACERLGRSGAADIETLCTVGVRGLTGELPDAYVTLQRLSSQGMPNAERAWRDSELGEMAVRLGRESEAEHWFRNGLIASPDDAYLRAAYADLLLRTGRAGDALALLKGHESSETLLLRIAIAQRQRQDPGLRTSAARLAAAFSAEVARGEAVHRREQARFLLEVEHDPQGALAAALANWRVQREADDVLVLVAAARACRDSAAAAEALAFVRQQRMQDARLASVSGS